MDAAPAPTSGSADGLAAMCSNMLPQTADSSVRLIELEPNNKGQRDQGGCPGFS